MRSIPNEQTGASGSLQFRELPCRNRLPTTKPQPPSPRGLVSLPAQLASENPRQIQVGKGGYTCHTDTALPRRLANRCRYSQRYGSGDSESHA